VLAVISSVFSHGDKVRDLPCSTKPSDGFMAAPLRTQVHRYTARWQSQGNTSGHRGRDEAAVSVASNEMH
jgi:hypothetical protein